MKAVNKQTVLKGALLAVLAANISWKIQSPNVMDNVTDLASASEQGKRAAAAPAAAPAVKLRPLNASAAKAGNGGVGTDAPAKAQSTKKVEEQLSASNEEREELLLTMAACDRDIEVKIFETTVKKDGKEIPAVRGEVFFNNHDIAAVNRNITLESFKKSDSKQKAMLALMTDEAEKSCPTEVASEDRRTTEQGEAHDEELEAARERAKLRADRIANGVKECKNDERGKVLNNKDRLYCHLDTIASDESDEIGDEEETGRRSRRGKLSSADSRFSRSVDFVMEEIAPLLSSDDSLDRKEGAALRKELELSLKEARANGNVSRGLVSKAQARVKALEDGAKVAYRENLYQAQAKQLDQQISQIQSQLPMAQAQSPMYAQMLNQQIQSLQQQKISLGTQSMPNDSLYTSYANLQSQGVVQATEYNAFTENYNALMRSLGGNQSPISQPGQIPGTALTPSPEATAFRNSGNGNLGVRSNGMPMPAFPQNTNMNMNTTMNNSIVQNPALLQARSF